MDLPRQDGGWSCIVADPPWSFRDKGSRVAPERCGSPYATMGLDDLALMPVRKVAARDALLFLWTTSAHLLDGSALVVARSWGFEPKATIAWVKTSPGAALLDVAVPGRRPAGLVFGMGHYVRGAHELVVVARRGRARVRRRDVPSVFFAPRGRHSAKPEAFLGIVERLARGPYLELFARSRRPRWTAWGDQLEPVGSAA